jgi:hypothetical protein
MDIYKETDGKPEIETVRVKQMDRKREERQKDEAKDE